MKVFKKVFTICSIFLVIFGVLGTTPIVVNGATFVSGSENALKPASLDDLSVTVTGLKVGDTATIALLPELALKDTEPIKQITVNSKGLDQVCDFSCSLKDGYYRLDISAPDEYFREPKSWLFMVVDSKLFNPQGKSAVFKLIPPDLQTYRPYRESEANSDTILETDSVGQLPQILVEPMQSLSDQPKSTPVGNVILTTGYHHFCWTSTLQSTGIWGRFTVVDPGVRHGGSGDMANDHIYIHNLPINNNSLEIGWIEGNWLSDTRYGFAFFGGNYYYFTLPGSPLEVKIQYGGSNTWSAYYMSGGSWLAFCTVNLGYSQYANALNGGEVYTDYATHPTFPAAYTDVSKIIVSGNWVNWDWQRWATSTLQTCDAYSLHTSTNYYNFYVHSD